MKERSVPLEIKMIDNMIMRKICENDKMKNITCVQADILKYLYQNKDKKIYQNDIEKEIGVRRSTISGILKTMEKNGLIRKEDSKEDARKKEITLTKKSYEIKSKMQKKVTSFETLLLNGISYEECKNFFRVIDKLKENLK